MEKFVSQMKALGDQNRFRISMMILERPLCACEMLQVLNISGGTLSNHLNILKNCGLLKSKKNGKWILYETADESSENLLKTVRSYVKDSDEIKDDIRKIGKVSCEICNRKETVDGTG